MKVEAIYRHGFLRRDLPALPAGTMYPPLQCPVPSPESIRPSLEAMGFDISRTASGIFGIPLQWASDGNPPAYLTLVSGLAY